MGRWKEGKGAALRAGLMLFAVLALMPLASADGPLLPPADLSVSMREPVAGSFGHSVSMIVENVGGSVSRSCRLSVWDEQDPLTGNGSVVLDRTLPEVQPGKSVEVDLEWHPSSQAFHRLWAFLDPDNDIVELTRSNNIAFRTVQLPAVPGVRLSLDGLPADDRAGTYFAEVPLELELQAALNEGFDPSLYRFEMYLDNVSSPLRSWSGGEGPVPVFDAGSLEPGSHGLVVAASFAGVNLGRREVVVDVAPLPEWTRTLSDLEVSFDPELGAYYLSGRMDIPRLELMLEGPNITALSPLVLFQEEGEILVRAWILPDGTTTFEHGLSAGSALFSDGSPLSASATDFTETPYLPEATLLRCGKDLIVDLSEHMEALPLDIDGSGLDLPVEPTSIAASGELELSLSVGSLEGGTGFVHGTLEIGLEGTSVATVFPDDILGPGGSVTVSSTLVWKASRELLPTGVWTGSGALAFERFASVTSLLMGDGSGPRSYASMSGSPYGPASAVHVTPWNGNMTALGLWREGSSLLLREIDGTMAEPLVANLEDGGHTVLWTEDAEVNITLPAGRPDRDLMWLQVDSSMVVRRKAAPLFEGPELDMRPTLATSPDGSMTLLSWVRDVDRDMSTVDDRRLMVASFNSSGWAGPVWVGTDGPAPGPNTCLFSGKQVPIVAWVDVNGTARMAVLDQNLKTGDVTDIGVPEGSRALDVSSLSALSDPFTRSGMIISRTGADGEGRFVLSVIPLADGSSVIPLEESVVAGSSSMIDGACGDQFEGGYCTLMWREAGQGNGTLLMAASPAGAGWTTWTPPLTLDPELPMTPSFSFRTEEEGRYWTVMARRADRANNDPAEPLRISLDEMNWACDIASFRVSAAEGYRPGDLASVRVTVINRGLGPEGTAPLHLYRSVRSRENGTMHDQHVLSEMVQFAGLNERKEVIFSVIVGDMQSGFHAVTTTPQGTLPYHRDERYVSLSAYPDPVFTAFRLEGGQPGGNLTVEVTLTNMGHSRLEGIPLVIVADGPTPPIAFGPGRIEPVGIRRMEGGSPISTFDVTVDPFQEVTFVIGLSPGNGTSAIWPELRGLGWLPDVPKGPRPIIVHRLPELGLRIVTNGPVHEPGRPMEVDLFIWNVGQAGPFSVYGEDDGTILPEGLRYMGPSDQLSLELVNATGAVSTLLEMNITVPPPGGHVRTTCPVWGDQIEVGRSRFDVSVTSGYGRAGQAGHSTRASADLLVPPVTLLEIGPLEEVLTPSGVPGFHVQVSNPTARRALGAILVLSNGRPEDGVPISDRLMVSVDEFGGSPSVLPLPLKEGSYLLSVSVIGFPSNAPTSAVGMVTLDVKVFEHDVVVVEEGDGPDGPDISDVTTSAIVAGLAFFAVISGAALFRLQRKEGS